MNYWMHDIPEVKVFAIEKCRILIFEYLEWQDLLSIVHTSNKFISAASLAYRQRYSNSKGTIGKKFVHQITKLLSPPNVQIFNLMSIFSENAVVAIEWHQIKKKRPWPYQSQTSQRGSNFYEISDIWFRNFMSIFNRSISSFARNSSNISLNIALNLWSDCPWFVIRLKYYSIISENHWRMYPSFSWTSIVLSWNPCSVSISRWNQPLNLYFQH